MNTFKLLEDLRKKNINIDIIDNELDIIAEDNNLTDDLLNHIRKNKKELLVYLKSKGKSRTTSDFTYDGLKLKEYKKLLSENGIDGGNIEDIYNLTPLQEGFLFHNQIDKKSSAYFEQISFDVEGSVDVILFEKGWEHVVRMHNSLRTMFLSDQTVPLQVVLRNRNLDFSYIDLCDKEDIDESIEEIKVSDRKDIFNLSKDPLFRIKLVKGYESKYTLILSFHHIILDGWCVPILISDFLDNYSKLVNSRELLFETNFKYSNYITWLNERDNDKDLKYWKTYLNGYEEVATIPKEYTHNYSGKDEQLNYSFIVDKAQTHSLRNLAFETGVTLNTIIQTVWGVILSRYNGKDDVVFGSTVSGRPQDITGIEQVVGLFINTVPVRIKADREKSFKEIAIVNQQNSLASINYQYSSLAEIQSKSGIGNALLDHIIVFENYPIDEALKENNSSLLKIGNVEAFEQINYDFGITIFPTEYIRFKFSYNPEIFSENHINRIVSHIRKVISEIIVKQDITIGEIDIVPDEEKNLLLNVFNDTLTDYPAEKAIMELFEEQVEKTPDDRAVIFEDVELTYRELNEKSNIVGHYLRDNFDIKADDLVGVLLNRSEKLIIAILGILKSGAAYVPIDPEYPEKRIDYMISDSDPKVVLSDRDDDLLIDLDMILKSDSSIDNLEKIILANNLAYVIYTSGSTGKPKGVKITNSNYLNYISWAKQYYFNNKDIGNFGLFTSISFDLTTTSIFLTLLRGKTLEVFNQNTDITTVLDRIFNSDLIDTIKLTPSHISILRDLKVSKSNTQLVIVGGEELLADQVEILRGIKSDVRIINEYGPTETTVGCIVKEIENSKERILIGKPISNTKVYLENNNSLVPVGVSGEICIGGFGIGVGYHNKPELTEEKFVDNPFISGERMYRTGDLGRWLPDGNIEFLGRIDDQVKIRGFRIEPGEIESSLLQHDYIKSAVVLVKEGIDGDRQLIAYYVSSEELEPSDIRNFIGIMLPEYMIPSCFIYMDAFPLTSNGKIDRKLLPDPDGNFNSGREYVSPRTGTEEVLVEIWEEILGVDNIGILDNFFELGGHSLKATRAVSRIRKQFDVSLNLKDIFDNQTIETLSEVISHGAKAEYKQIYAVPEHDFYDISNAQKRLWILDQLEKENISYNITASFIMKGKLDIDSFNKALTLIIERHESLRTVFITEDGEPKQKILENPEYKMEIIDLRENFDGEKEAKNLAEKDILIPFNLKIGPLFRFNLIRIEDEKNLLLFNMHHIISDGWSMNIFVMEFLSCYHSYKKRISPDLKPLRIHYKDYSVWQNKLLDCDKIDKQKKYWYEKLSGDIPALNLPSDKIRPVVKTYNGGNIGFTLNNETTVKLNNLCSDNHATMFMMLQTVVKILLYRYSGQNDILLGSPIAGRNHEDLENQIGFYVNTLVLRDSISNTQTFIELLGSIKKTCTEAFKNQDYPFDRLLEDLDIKRDLSRSPFFDVMLVLQNNKTTAIEFDGLTVTPYETENTISKFDMTLRFSESEGVLSCDIDFNTDIYSDDRIERMVGHLETLISSVLENPQSRIRDLETISEEEKYLLLHKFNDTRIEYAASQTIIELFEEQVRKTPDNIALLYEDVELTYRELNKKSNKIGNYLRDNHDIEPNDLVGVLLERSEKIVIALLGILKSGAAYVPLDPGYPQERIDNILEDSNPKVVLNDIDNGLFIDINTILESCLNNDNPKKITNPDNLVYVIYTSGSTGKPKGTLVRHSGLFNYLLWMKDDYGKKAGSWPLVTSYAFDLCVTALYTPLLSGNSLIIYKSDLDVSETLYKCFSDTNVDSVKLTPSHISILEELDIEETQIKYVFTGGEELKVENIRTLRRLNPEIEIINHYGPTESTVGCIANRIDKDSESVELGRPISNTRIYVLDEGMGLLPVGVPGELCISGSGLAQGYINRPELTYEKFMENPFVPGERMYRTGDLARWGTDGSIEFLGRIDNQVKIRGFRIELAEIENILLLQEDISSTVVIVKEDIYGERQIVAYYVSENEIEITVLRGYLGTKLPDFMIPDYFIHLNFIPLTSNGKINRKVLPEPDGNINTGVEYVTPRNKTEEKLVEIWEDILGLNHIGIFDNFFILGGHSLKATRVVSRISKNLNVEIKLKDIFEYPTIDSITPIIYKSDIIQYRQIEPIWSQDSYELSNAQRRLWILDQLDEDRVAYNMPAAFYLEGEFNEEAFRKAHFFIIERHESLRTVVVMENGEPRQKIQENPSLNFEMIDLVETADKNGKVRELVEKEILTSFNLEEDSLIRFTIIKVETGRYLLLFNMHHIISDGWSMSIFTRELLSVYNSFRKGGTSDLKPLRIHYKDYSAWQNNLLQMPIMEKQKEYWLGKLSGKVPILDIPSDKPRPIVQTFNGERFEFPLPKAVHSSLNNLSRENQTSLFMMLQALVKVLFHRYTGQEDIIIGSPVAGRWHEDLENQIGFYVNTLVLRDSIKSDLTFLEFLNSVRETCKDAYDNQDYPFDRLIEELDLKRDLSRSPLFDVMLVLQNNEEVVVEFEGLRVSPYETETQISKFDMTFSFIESKGDLICRIEYNTDIYSNDRIKRMSEHLRTLVHSIIRNPSSRISDFEIIPEDERYLLLNTFNDTKADYPMDKTIIDLFEEQVEKTPDNIAVVFENVELTYGELNNKANTVGHYLRENYEIKPDDLVSVMLERSEKMIIAILGVLKSGGAYVPIDTGYPQERIDFILEDSNSKAVLSDLDSGIFINIDNALDADLNTDNPEKISDQKNLAYVIYTSGSTGKPKGVLIDNRSVINLITSQISSFDVDLNDKILQFSSICFDASVEQIFISLFSGAALVLVSKDLIGDMDIFSRFINDKEITHIHSVPNYLEQIEEGEYPSLKRVVSGGDVCTQNIASRWFSSCDFYNEYGPTETSVTTTMRKYNKITNSSNQFIDIGKPLPNIRIYILDKNNDVTPIGNPGELCISGVCLARGYLKRPDLTTDNFVDNPFSTGERMFRTGDLARWLPDGNIEFLGRIDNQVKIRGFRIEPGEIESSLIELYAIISAIVVVKEGTCGDKQLIAYYLSENELDISEIRNSLRKSLPDYMIPSFFIRMEIFPLTPNGKVDRKALPVPDGNISSCVGYVAPRDDIEDTLVDIWQKVLGIEKIGIHDNFFDLGGHSLKATRVISRISRDLEVGITLKDIFANPTIESISEVISQSVKIDYLQIEAIPIKDSYEISNAQRRLWILDQLDEESSVYNNPGVFILEGEFDEISFNKAYSFIIDRHESLRTIFIIEEEVPKQIILEKIDSSIKNIDLKVVDDKEERIKELVKDEFTTSFDLTKGPLVRLGIINIDERKNLLLFNMHHIVSDGWSMNILTREFFYAYNCFRVNQTPDLEPLRIHYKDYSAWQNKLLGIPDMVKQRVYWFDKLGGELPVLNLPSCKVRPAVKTFNGDSYEFLIPRETNLQLIDLCKENNVSLFMILQALVKTLFYRYTSLDDIILGSPIAGRNHEDLEGQIGFYVNTLIFRDTISCDQTFNEFLFSVKKTCTDAFDNQDYPFDQLVDDLDMKRDLSRSPLFDVMLVLQNNETPDIEFDGLIASPLGTETKISKFDMTFNFTESENGLKCGIEYNTDIFIKVRIKQMVGHFKTLIKSVLKNPKVLMKDLEIITEDEKNLLLNIFNDTKADYPEGKTIVDLFEEQVEKTPNNIAVIFKDIELTYMELNRKANIVGHYLRDNYDIDPDDLVGVLQEKSERMIISLLGILKSGAAYVPIDPEYPENRINFILNDSNPKVVLANRNGNAFVDIDTVLETCLSLENPQKITTPDNLAYVIYTSGSTGKPKGTLLEHSGLINMSLHQIKDFEIYGSDVILQFASASFDASMYEIFMALFSGSSLVIPDNGIKGDIDEFQKYIIEKNVTVATLPPAFLENLDKENIRKLRILITAGEKPNPLTVDKYYRELKYINAYGPTEASVCITSYCTDSESECLSEIPIGKPISNMKIYILDQNKKLVPNGVPGELCVSGVGIARGYLNRAELTVEKFIDNPFASNERMYRTGDLARWLPDGNIEFIGRIDHQVKIRGFRIEIGEIENTILQLKNIDSSVVVAKESMDGDKQLVAYCTSNENLEIPYIRSFLGDYLPDYMIPSYFIQMERFPLTSNGKIDRKGLPEPDGTINVGVEYVAPKNRIEEKLAEIWGEILGIDNIGIMDNFFDHGGHSLKATRVISRISKDFHISISLKEIFSNPTIETLSEIISQSNKTEFKQIELINEQDSYDISNAQRRLWILDQFKEKSIAYNMPFAFILEGELKTKAFNQAYSFMLKRHESLRTIFVTVDGEPKQKILENPGFEIEIIDLRGCIDTENETRILAEKNLMIPFNLETGPLVRLTVVKEEDDRHLLLFNMHHIISDGWSMDIFTTEFLEAYTAFSDNRSPEFTPLRVQYKDYSAWQNTLLKSSGMDSQRGYWLDKLSGEIPMLDLPSDKVRPAIKTFNGRSMGFSIPQRLQSALNDLCRENKVSLFMMLQALVKTLIHRYTGEEDIIIGSPVAGRCHEDLENQIGFYVNTLVFRDRITSGLSFNELLAYVRKNCTEAFDNQDYPFDRLVEDLDVKRDLSRSTLFDVMLVLQNNDSTVIEFDDLTVTPYETENTISKFDMTFSFSEGEEGLYCRIQYNNDIYSKDRIERMVGHLRTLITSVLKNPKSRIKDLEIIPVDEKNLLLNVFNDTKTDYPSDKTIMELFEDQAQKTPDNIALVFKDVELTYSELNKKSNMIAHYLRDNYAIKPDDLVGIILERSEKMVIALLGILKSGAAYVPIDPEYPVDRIDYMLEDSSPKVVLSEREDGLLIDFDKILDTDLSRENPKKISNPDNLAYVIYTSGSTGRPKGTLIENKSVINLVHGLYNCLYKKYNVFLSFSLIASFSFDASVKQIFSSLLFGHSLHLVPLEYRSNIEELLGFYTNNSIDVVDGTPVLMELIVDKIEEYSDRLNIKEFIIGGDVLLKATIRQLLLKSDSSFNPQITNVYGPTECCVDSSLFHCKKIDTIESKNLYIGKPIPNTQIFIVDQNQNLLPCGVVGELCISGYGLARGYLNKEKLTEENFIDNPFIPGKKMYKTGDFACWLPDGNIEFLGRIDDQVKIRGFRIEPGEIENCIIQHEDIDSVIILAKEGIGGDNQLVAYYISEKEFEVSELRKFLGKSLPEYMIPTYFIHLESFPINPNGKIDRKALPEPAGNMRTGVEYIAPSNGIEKNLVKIWQEILDVEKVGINDNFFDLGGHSLKAIKMILNINKLYKTSISLREIYEDPTIQWLSVRIDILLNCSSEIINNKKSNEMEKITI